MIVAVFDTNVLLSGYVWGGVPFQCIERARQGTIAAVTCREILDELGARLQSKGGLSLIDAVLVLDNVRMWSQLVSIKKLLHSSLYTNATARGLSAFRRQGKRRAMLPIAVKRVLPYNSTNGCFGRPVASSDAAPEQQDMLLVVSLNSCGT